MSTNNKDYYTLDELQDILARRRPLIQDLVSKTMFVAGSDSLISMGPDDTVANGIIDENINALKLVMEKVESEYKDSEKPEYVVTYLEIAENALTRINDLRNAMRNRRADHD